MARTTRTTLLALLVGYLGLFVGILAAHAAPASGYELSLYSATPVTTFVGLGIALGVAVGVILTSSHTTRRFDAGRLLAGSATLAIFTLPIIRGYEFYGAGDAMSHVGWSRELAAGTLSPGDLLYPGIHSITVATSSVAGVPLTQANMYVVLLLFPLAFLLFVPLTTVIVTGTRRALGVGLLVAILFTPINNVSVHPIAHPASQTILLLPFLLYLVLRYVTHGGPPAGPKASPVSQTARPGARAQALLGLDSTAIGVLLALTSAAVVLFHPQQALNVALCFTAVTVLQLGASRWLSDGPIASHRPLHFQTGIIILAFFAWAPRFERTWRFAAYITESILGQGVTTGVVASKSVSLNTIGGSLPMLFLKLFLPALVCSLLAGTLILYVIRHRIGNEETTARIRYLAMVLVPMFAIFLVVLAADVGDMYFRYQGFIMVPVTILAAVALFRGGDLLASRTSPRTAIVAVLVLFLVLTPAGLVALHTSPYMYQPTQHVPQTQLAGYSSSFEHRAEDVAFIGIRGGPQRYVDYHYGTERAMKQLEFPGYRAALNESVFRNARYRTALDEPRYLAVTQSTYEREVRLYRGFRHPESGFQALERTPNVNRVRSNDDFDLYYISESQAA